MQLRDKFTPELAEILEHMCWIIDVNYEHVDFDNRQWFIQHSWTTAQQDEFHEWLTKYLMRKRGWSRMLAEKEATWFVFDFGWRVDDERSTE